MNDAPESSPTEAQRQGEAPPAAPVAVAVRAGDRLRCWRADGSDFVHEVARGGALDAAALGAVRVALPDGRVLDVVPA